MTPTEIPWRDPWCSIEDEPDADRFVRELQKEMPPTHVLAGRQTKAIGMRIDRDEFLFLLDGNGPACAVVHLTFSREKNPAFPGTRVYVDVTDFVVNCLEPDAAEYAAIEP